MLKLPEFSVIRKAAGNYTILDQVVFSANSFLTTILLARILGIAEFGVYASILIILYLFLSLQSALIISPFQVLHAKESDSKQYLSSLFLFQVVFCLLFAGFLIAVSLIKIDMFTVVRQNLWEINGLMFGFLFQDYTRRVMLVLGLSYQAFVSDLVNFVLQIGCLVVMFCFHSHHFQLCLLILSITYLPSIIYAIAVLKPVLPERGKMIYFLKTHIDQGKWLLLTAAMQWVTNNIFVLASGLYLGVKALGAFRLAQTIFGVFNLVLQLFENHVVPEASRLYALSADAFGTYVKKISHYAYLLMFPALLITFFFAKTIFYYGGGKSYYEYAYVMQGLAIIYCMIIVSYPVRTSIRVLLLNRAFFIAYLISFVFSLVSVNYLVKTFGLTGVMIGLFMNQLVTLGYWKYVLYRNEYRIWR